MPRFAIVEFEDKAVAVILETWFVGDEEIKCRWPNMAPAKAAKLVMRDEKPCSSWQLHTVRVLGKAGTYERALEKLRMSEETSDINTDVEEASRKRRRIRSARVLANESTDSESDSEAEVATPIVLEDLPTPPSPPPACPQSAPEPALPALPDFTTSTRPASPAPIHTPSTTTTFGTPTQTGAEGERTYVVGEKLLHRLLDLALENRESLTIQAGILQAMSRKVNGLSQAEITMPDGINFPLDTEEDLQDIDKKLVDPAIANGLVSVLGDLGGRTLDECTKRTMGHTISTNLCLKLNMCGRNGKKAFGPTNFFQVVYRSIKKNPQTADCTKQNIERAVSKWLVGGRDRDGNRARRMQLASPRSPSLNGQSH